MELNNAWLGTHHGCPIPYPHTHPRPRRAEAPNASRRFELQRDLDVSGVSGTGVVAEGIAVVHWIAGEHHSTVVWPDVAGVEAIHGHGGATRLVWLDR